MSLNFRSPITPPTHKVPGGSCDCHLHIVGPLDRFPLRETRTFQPGQALLEDYRNMAETVGIERMVIVQPSFFGTDNSCTLNAVAVVGDKARAVVVVDPRIGDTELSDLHAQGARGIRIQTYAEGGLSLDVLEHLAERIQPFGWHIQLFLDAESLPDIADRLWSCPVQLVFDHMAHIHKNNGIQSPGFRVLLDLLASGRAWVKLSNALFEPSVARARALVECNPSRVVWGSDWPHVAYKAEAPDDGHLLDALFDWVPDERTSKLILVDNPKRLYFDDRDQNISRAK